MYIFVMETFLKITSERLVINLFDLLKSNVDDVQVITPHHAELVHDQNYHVLKYFSLLIFILVSHRHEICTKIQIERAVESLSINI